ncbi:dipeptide epimerase [Flagellimonas meridianipacifica]|uniref:Dipeptide epimerase n=1 Tax=Flagellimonas meridianipacifica TaxID=1080225 RepID=A0A2T0MBC2_9FLAO|nr:dipeptide epimerase [Allomuricauda pacifica]PRX54800.1 L-alanine-DL-glutamate epimerase-like enolase superfamily enzyme [Allomuricauda pacifica]
MSKAQVDFKILYLKKKFPLRISRGVRDGQYNLYVSITKEGFTGWGETSPGLSEGAETPEIAQSELERFLHKHEDFDSPHEAYDRALELGIAPCAFAALDMASWDLKAKKANMPLYQLLGFPKPKHPTSITLGIMTPKEAAERLPLILENEGIHTLKVKLGNNDGIEADKAMYSQVLEYHKKYPISIRVDANGGWTVKEAQEMMKWLAERECEYVEQPLKEGQESELPYLFKNRPLPIFLDESCRFATDIPKWAHSVDGVNMKLMKCGGITGALRIISTAHAFGLKTMIGCMGESSISIAAGAAVSGMLDHVDLDSHLNLNPDPCEGAPLVNEVTMPLDIPGHGGKFKSES